MTTTTTHARRSFVELLDAVAQAYADAAEAHAEAAATYDWSAYEEAHQALLDARFALAEARKRAARDAAQAAARARARADARARAACQRRRTRVSQEDLVDAGLADEPGDRDVVVGQPDAALVAAAGGWGGNTTAAGTPRACRRWRVIAADGTVYIVSVGRLWVTALAVAQNATSPWQFCVTARDCGQAARLCRDLATNAIAVQSTDGEGRRLAAPVLFATVDWCIARGCYQAQTYSGDHRWVGRGGTPDEAVAALRDTLAGVNVPVV